MAALVAAAAVGAPGISSAQVQVNVGIRVPLPPLPRFVFKAPPPVVVIPDTYLYVVPDVDVDIVFYHGYWYRPHAERWYRATSYNGPWRLLSVGQVPAPFQTLAPGFRSVKPEHERIPYQKVRKNWKQWEKTRYWDANERHGDQGRHEERRGPGGAKGHDR
jgi:hypothetical protein